MTSAEECNPREVILSSDGTEQRNNRSLLIMQDNKIVFGNFNLASYESTFHSIDPGIVDSGWLITKYKNKMTT